MSRTDSPGPGSEPRNSTGLLPGSPRLNVVLVEPEIALNTGSIGRTCVRRAGLDYWEHLSWRVVDRLDEVVSALGRDRLWSFSTKASRIYTDARFRAGDALIFGPESRGLPAHWLNEQRERTLRIPIRAEARSLNLANAVSVGVFEAVRQLGPGDI
jgi:tRNA (cytidine/uridine-2'-O-)-methyltransferase